MTLNSQNKVGNNTVELVITVSPDVFEAEVEKSYKKNVMKMNIPGFRKGKAPRKMIEKMYGADVFYDDAVNAVYPEAYEEAIKEAKITPVDRASVEIISIDSEGFKFKATVTVKPEVEIKDYKGIKVEKDAVKVSASEVDSELEAYRKRQARLIDAEEDAVTKNGDSVTFDFEGFVDGKAFEGGKAEDFSLVLGSGQFIPGFEDQMIGKKAGEKFTVNVKFPEDYHAEELKGKDAEFKINLKSIKYEELPELDDEFAKDVSDFDTLKEFKDDIKKRILERKEKDAEYKLEADLSDKLAEMVVADIPQCMFDQEINRNLQEFENRFVSQGISLEQYMQYTGTTIDSLKEMFRANAEKDVKVRLALEKIAELEGVVITEAEVEEEYNRYATEMGLDISKIKSDYMSEQIMKDLSIRKAFEAVKNTAEITIGNSSAKKNSSKKASAEKAEASAEKSTEKKASAKKTSSKKTTASVKSSDKSVEKTSSKATGDKKPAGTSKAKKTTGESATKKSAAKKTASKSAGGKTSAEKEKIEKEDK